MAIYKHVVSGPGAAGDVWTSGLHTSGIGTLEAANTAWLAFVTEVCGVGGFQTYWSTLTKVREVLTYSLNTATGKSTALTRAAATIDGADAGQSAPPRDALVVGLRSNRPGPGGRGRMYFPLVSDGHRQNNGLIDTAVQTALASVIANALDDMASAGFQPVVWRKPDAVGDVITSVTISAVPGNQRRRSNKIPPAYASALVE